MTTTYSGVGRPPERRLHVLLLGAGASKAAGLPLTEELLENVWPRSGQPRWSTVHGHAEWKRRLSRAIQVLYPEGGSSRFRPSVADFFTVLEVVAAVHEGRARLPLRASSLLEDLRTEIAAGLQEQLRQVVSPNTPHHRWLTGNERPDAIITSNWDTLAELASLAAGLRVHLTWPRDTAGRRITNIRAGHVVVLKLHGSVDWGLYGNRTRHPSPLSDLYAALTTVIGEPTQFPRARKKADMPLRFRSLEGAATAGVGFRPPLMATMAVGKQTQIEMLGTIWDDAYWLLSRACRVDVVGYSFPQDDLELRTLLRTTTRQATKSTLDPRLQLSVVNPSPDAHTRARSFLGKSLHDDYSSGSDWEP